MCKHRYTYIHMYKHTSRCSYGIFLQLFMLFTICLNIFRDCCCCSQLCCRYCLVRNCISFAAGCEFFSSCLPSHSGNCPLPLLKEPRQGGHHQQRRYHSRQRGHRGHRHRHRQHQRHGSQQDIFADLQSLKIFHRKLHRWCASCRL